MSMTLRRFLKGVSTKNFNSFGQGPVRRCESSSIVGSTVEGPVPPSVFYVQPVTHTSLVMGNLLCVGIRTVSELKYFRTRWWWIDEAGKLFTSVCSGVVTHGFQSNDKASALWDDRDIWVCSEGSTQFKLTKDSRVKLWWLKKGTPTGNARDRERIVAQLAPLVSDFPIKADAGDN